MSKRILDACCGSKMFWYDKNNTEVEFCDKREVPLHEYYPGRYIEIAPDTVCDFTALPFPDNSFYLVVFDPPHLLHCGDKSITALKYGRLGEDWQEELSKGFDECMRVLRPNGVLVFKWSERDIPLSRVLALFSQPPLFGSKCRTPNNITQWAFFMKDEEDKQ